MTKVLQEDLEVSERLRAWIRYLIRREGITRFEFARRIGMHHSQISRLLAGTRGQMSVGYVLRVSRTFDVDMNTFLMSDPPPGL